MEKKKFYLIVRYFNKQALNKRILLFKNNFKTFYQIEQK